MARRLTSTRIEGIRDTWLPSPRSRPAETSPPLDPWYIRTVWRPAGDYIAGQRRRGSAVRSPAACRSAIVRLFALESWIEPRQAPADQISNRRLWADTVLPTSDGCILRLTGRTAVLSDPSPTVCVWSSSPGHPGRSRAPTDRLPASRAARPARVTGGGSGTSYAHRPSSAPVN